jgi:hypothetical protein
MSYKFTWKNEYKDFDVVPCKKVEMRFADHVTIDEFLEEVTKFMKACGYYINNNQRIELVYDETYPSELD